MDCINRLLLFLLPLLVNSEICNEQIRLNGRQEKSSIYCSSCSTYIDEQITAPIIQLELPTLSQLTGIYVQHDEANAKFNSYFLEYRRTHDGPWRVYGQRQEQKLFLERRHLYFNEKKSFNRTRTFLPLIIARQIRLIFFTSSVSTCATIQIFGCQSKTGLISTRFSQKSLIKPDLKYDGLITNLTARGGLGLLNDGDTDRFLQWTRSSEPILLLFAFDSIKEFQSIYLDMKCTYRCTFQINIGIFEIITSTNLWTNRFRSITIERKDIDDNRTITHLILTLSKRKGQFLVLQINTNDYFELSEVTFNNNDFYFEQDILTSSIYIETNLHRLESFIIETISDDTTTQENLFNLLIFVLLTCALLMIILLISCMYTPKKMIDIEKTQDEIQRSLTDLTLTNDDHQSTESQSNHYSNLQIHIDDSTLVNSKKIINESSHATIRSLPLHRHLSTSRYLTHLSEINSNEIIILENLGMKNHQQCFLSEYGSEKISVILYEQENNEFFNLSKFIDHSNIVSCFGYVNVTPERCLFVSEFSRINLFDHCQNMNNDDPNILKILMGYLKDLVSALMHLESLNIILKDLTLPNCLLFNMKTVKLSDYAKYDDRFIQRYVQKMPIRWLPGDIITEEESWSIETNCFMFGTLVFELFHLGSIIPYKNLSDDDVLEFYRNFWSNSKQNSMEPSVLYLSKYFPRPSLCNDRLYALIERCLSWSKFDRPSFREIVLCLDETTATTTTTTPCVSH